MVNPTKPRFIADVMVGRLARWLRILGFDVLYSNRYADDEIIAVARNEGRVVLTRDNGLFRRLQPGEGMFIDHDDYDSQVAQVLAGYPADRFELLSRCAECNNPLDRVDREEVFLRVPPYVYLTQQEFAECSACRRVYWRGTHADEIAKKLQGWTS